MAEISKIILPNGDEYKFKVFSNNIAPMFTKKYESTSYYATANNQNDGTWYFMSIIPDAWNKVWRVSFKLHTYCPNYPNYNSVTLSTISGRQNGITYMNFNQFDTTGHYYISFYPLLQAGFNAGYGHAVGMSIYNATSYTNANYYRTFEVELMQTQGCTVNFLETPVKWTSWTGNGTTYYGTLSNLNGASRGLQETGDANDVNYYSREYGGGYWKISAPLYRYQILIQDSEDTLLPVNSVNNNIETTKTLTTQSFNPFGKIYYYTTTTNYTTVGARITGTAILGIHYRFDLRYAFNTGSTLVAWSPIYIRAVMQSDGSAKLASNPIAQALPTTEDGFIYIYLGYAYNTTSIEMFQNHPVYQYKDGKIVELLQPPVENRISNRILASRLEPTNQVFGDFWLVTQERVDSCVVNIEPVQDLHGYDSPWPAGGGVNKFNYLTATPAGGAYGLTNISIDETGLVTIAGTYNRNVSTASFGILTRDSVNYPDGVNTLAFDKNTDADTVQIAVRRWDSTGGIAVDLKNLVENQVYNIQFRIVMFDTSGSTPTKFTPYSNICPITGWTGANVQKCGINVWDEECLSGYYSIYGNNKGEYVYNASQLCSKNFIPVKPNTQYMYSKNHLKGDLIYFDINKNFIGGEANKPVNSIFTTPSNCYFVMINLDSEYGATYNNNVSINYPSTDTEYHPFTYAGWGGKNLLNYDTMENKTIDSSGNESSISTRLLSALIDVKANNTYFISFPTGYKFIGFCNFDLSGNWVSNVFTNNSVGVPITPTSPKIKLYFQRSDNGNISKSELSNAQLELGSSATEYEPYIGIVRHISWQSEAGTVYGGHIDLVSGELVVDRKSVIITGSENIWASQFNRFYTTIPDAVAVNSSNQRTLKSVLCERFKSVSWVELASEDGNMCCSPVWGNGIAFRNDDITTAVDWKTYFTNNPTQFSYELAEPITYHLTPTQIQDLTSEDINLWADAGELIINGKTMN